MLRDEIAEIVYGEHNPHDITWHICRTKADRILSLLDAELKKARRYDAIEKKAESDARKAMVRKNGHYMCELTTIKMGELDELRDKARKWDRVVGIAAYEDSKSCAGCPIETVVVCQEVCLCMQRIVDALEGEVKDGINRA